MLFLGNTSLKNLEGQYSHYRFSPDDLVLYASGRKMDIIKTLGIVMPGSREEDTSVKSHVELEWEHLARKAFPYHTGEIFPTIFW